MIINVLLLLSIFSVVVKCLYLHVGWSWQCLEDWSTFSLVVLPSVVMTFIFWLSTEVGTFLSGQFCFERQEAIHFTGCCT